MTIQIGTPPGSAASPEQITSIKTALSLDKLPNKTQDELLQPATDAIALRATTEGVDAIRSNLQASIDAKIGPDNAADQATAEEGLDNGKFMTALRVSQQLAAKVPLLLSSTMEIAAQSQLSIAIPQGFGSTAINGLGCSLTALDSSTPQVASNVDGVFRRMVYRSAASALNRGAGFQQANGNVRLDNQSGETVFLVGFGDANFASGSILAGLYDAGNATIANFWLQNPSAMTHGMMVAACDETDTFWQLLWRKSWNVGGMNKVATPLPRVRHHPLMVYFRPNDAGTRVFVRMQLLDRFTAKVLAGTVPFEYEITTGLDAASAYNNRIACRGTLAGVNHDGATAFQAELMFGGMYCGRLPALNYQVFDPTPVPANREVTAATVAGDLVLKGTDIGATLYVNSATPVGFTVPSDTLLGFTGGVTAPVVVYIADAGVPTFTAGAGVTIIGTPPAGLAQGDFFAISPTGKANTWAYVKA